MKKKRFPFIFRSSKYLNQYVFSIVVGLFLAGAVWIQDGLKETRLPVFGEPAELYSNQTNDNLTKTFSEAIGKAQKSVLLVIYSLTDPSIISALRQKSQEGINVQVICDAKASPYINSKLGPRISAIRRFGPGLMHQKILVIDGQQSWIGSANMTTESLRMHGNLVAALDHPYLAQKITAKAQSMEVEGYGKTFPSEHFNVGGQNIELWFLPDDKNAVNRLKRLIQSAEKSIRIAMFTWTRHDLAQEVIAAAKRGVDTQIVIDHYSGKGAGAKVVSLLAKNGIAVSLSQGGPLLHHKFMYIDRKVLVSGSANWTKAAFTQNDDCFIVMKDLTPKQIKQMDVLWQTIADDSIKVK